MKHFFRSAFNKSEVAPSTNMRGQFHGTFFNLLRYQLLWEIKYTQMNIITSTCITIVVAVAYVPVKNKLLTGKYTNCVVELIAE